MLSLVAAAVHSDLSGFGTCGWTDVDSKRLGGQAMPWHVLSLQGQALELEEIV
jgi:hypothetical protein